MATLTKDPQAELAKTIAGLEKKLGMKGMVHPASETPPVYHVPFRNPHLNYITDGGIPWNRWAAFIGDPSTGKSYAVYEVMAAAQGLPATADAVIVPRVSYHRSHGHDRIVARLMDEQEWIHDNFPDGAEACFYDIEGQFDKRRAQQVGIDIDRLYLAEFNLIEDIGLAMEELFPYFHVHALDSTSNAISLLRAKEDPGKSLVGTESRQWKYIIGSAQTKFGPLKNGTGIPNMVMMVHQMSTNISTGGAQAATGRAMRHLSSMTIKFTKGPFLWEKDDVLSDTKETGTDKASMAGRAEADGTSVLAQVEKSRTCRPFKVGSLQFDYRKLRFVPIHELATTGIHNGIIEKSGSWYRIAGIEGDEGKIGQGLKNVYTHLANDGDLRDQIMASLLDNSDDE